MAHVSQHSSAPSRGAAHDRRRRTRRRPPVRPQGERLEDASAPGRGRVRGRHRGSGRSNGAPPRNAGHAAHLRRSNAARSLAAIGPSPPSATRAPRVTDDAARLQWAAVAEQNGAHWRQANAPDLGWLVAALDPSATDRALDVGTGGGHAALALAPALARRGGPGPAPGCSAGSARALQDRAGWVVAPGRLRADRRGARVGRAATRA